MHTTNQEPKISIIIPCLNEENYVGKLLNDLAQQQDAPMFEVVVVDSSSADATVEIVESFTNRLPLSVIKLNERGVARARNAGADTASGRWLFFFDAKVRVSPSYIGKVFHALGKRKADFGTSSFNTKSWHPFDKIFFHSWSWGFRFSFWKGDYLMNGSTIFVKRSLHHKIGGFNPDIEIGEDIDYAKRLTKFTTNGVFIPVKMYLSNRRLIYRGRINAVLMMLHWNNLVPKKVGEYIDRDYFERQTKIPFWRSVVRICLHIVLLGIIILAIYRLYT